MLHFLALPIVMSAFAAENPSGPERLPILPHDNLSTVSKTIFGDGNYWPKIWNRNARMIHSGNTIQFLLGDEETPPSFAISENDDDTSTTPIPRALSLKPAAAKASSGEFELPPPKVRPKPVLNLGSMMPPWSEVKPRKSGFVDPEVEILSRKPLVALDRIFLPVFVQDGSVRPVGEYIQTASDSGLVYDGEEVLVRMKSGSGQIGAHYLLLRDGGTLEEGWATSGGHHDGHIVEVLAEIVLTSSENSEHDGSWDHFRGTVTHAIGASARGAAIVPGQVTWVNTEPNGEVSNVQAEVIGGNYDPRGLIFGQGDWVFLNRGAKDGLAEGQLLWVNSLPRNYVDHSPFELGVRNSALIKIAKVASEMATGFVLTSKQGVMQHDFSGGAPIASVKGAGDKQESNLDIPEEMNNSNDSDIGIDSGTDSLDDNDLKDLDNTTYDSL